MAKLPTVPCRKKINEGLYNKLLRGKLDQLSLEERRLIETVIVKYAHVFHDENTNDFKPPTCSIMRLQSREIRLYEYRSTGHPLHCEKK